MAQIETWLKTDLKQIVRVQELDGQLFTADNQANLIGVIVTDHGQPVALSGGVTGYVIRSDGYTVMITGSLQANKATIVLPASCYVKAGPIHIVIKVGNTTVGACTSYVGQSTTDNIVDPGHIVPSLPELLAQIENCRAATTAANNAADNANDKASAANLAANNANNKASLANTATTNANNAATRATTAAGKIDNMTVEASGLAAGMSPTVTISEVSGHKHVSFGLPKGDKGDPGKDFEIRKTFVSIAAMQAYDPDTDTSTRKMRENDFALIDTGNVQDADTGKLFCYEPSTQEVWRYIGDLSGAQGIRGETGNGIANIVMNANYTLTITMTDGTEYTTAVIRDAVIDDTAGAGATDRVWSANKVLEVLASKADKANPEFTGNGSFTGHVTVGPGSEKLGVIRDGFLFNEERFLKPLEATETLAGTTWFFTVNGYFTATAVSCTFISDSPYPGSLFPGDSGPYTHTLTISTNYIADTITSAGRPSQTVYMYGSQYHPGTWDDQNHRVYTIPNEPTSYSPDKETFMETFLATAIRVSEYEIIDNALYCDIESGIEYLWDGTQFVDILKNGFDLKANKNNPEFSGHASFGYNSEATGNYALASGDSAIASGNYSNSLGRGTKAAGSSSHVVGRYNIEDVFPLWVADTHYYVDDIVKVERRLPIGGGIYYVYRICTIENEDSSFDESKWVEYPESSRYVEIVGNGESNNSRSNARTLDWDGNERLKGNIYVNCNSDGSGGTKLDPIVFATDSEIQDIVDDWEVSA